MYVTGGGGGTYNYVCILGMCRKRNPHFQPWISVPEHIICKKLPYSPFRSITIYSLGRILHYPETSSFSKSSLISTRSSPPMAAAQNVSAAPRRVSGRSGAPHLLVHNGSSSSRSPAVSISGTTQARSGAPQYHAGEGARSGALAQFISLPRYIVPTRIWGEYPPPPPPGTSICLILYTCTSSIIFIFVRKTIYSLSILSLDFPSVNSFVFYIVIIQIKQNVYHYPVL